MSRRRRPKGLRSAIFGIAAVVLSVGIGAAAAAVGTTGASVASCRASGPADGLYTVNLCITRPEPDEHVTGDVAVAASATVDGTDPGIDRLTFFLDGEYVLTDEEAPYEFTLETSKLADGERTLDVEASMRDGFATERTSASFVYETAVAASPASGDTTTGDSAGGEENAEPAGEPASEPISEPMVVAATDLNAPASVSAPTGGVLFRDGFESGDFSAWSEANGLTIQQSHVFSGSYAAEAAVSGSGGASASRQLEDAETDLYYVARFKVLSRAPATNINLLRFRNTLPSARPIATVYVTSTDKLGLRNDVRGITTTSSAVAAQGAWHTVQMHVMVNGGSSRTEVWLDGVAVPELTQSEIDLGTDPIGRFELGDPATDKTYDIAYDEAALGREFIDDLLPPTAPAHLVASAPSGLEVQLTWTPATDDVAVSGYDVYRNDALLASLPPATSYTDHAVSPRTNYTYTVRAKDAAGNVSGASNAALVFTGDVFRDDFEAGDLSSWTTVGGLTVQQETVDRGAYAARAASDGSGGSSAQVRLAKPVDALYYRARFRVASQGANPINLLRFRNAANGALASVYYSNTNKIGYRNDTSGFSVTTRETVSKEVWHEVQLYLAFSGDSRTVEVSLDGIKVITQTESGPGSIGRLELGDHLSGRSFDVAFDDVVAGFSSLADVAPPSKPENLRSSSHTASEVELAWDDASDDIGVAGYRVYRDGVAIANADATTTWYIDTHVTGSTTYTYTVTALDAVGRESSASNEVAVTTSDVTKPSKPEALSAIAAADGDRVDLSWSPSSDDVGVSGYRIYRDGSATPLAVVDASTTSFSDAAVTSATTYSYTVTAIDQAGNESDASDAARVRTADAVSPEAPTAPTAPSGTSSQPSVTTADTIAPAAPNDSAASGPATAPTSDPVGEPETAATGTTIVFADDFESGKLSRWSTVRGLRVQKAHRFAGAFGARASAAKKVARFATKRLPQTYTDLYYTVRLKIVSSPRADVDVIGFRTAANANIISLRYDSRRRLRYLNGATGKSVRSNSVLALNTWHELKLHLALNGAASLVEVWLNGTKVPELSRTDIFRSPIGMIVAGEAKADGRYSFALDDVVIAAGP